MAMIARLPTLNATAMPMIEPLRAPIASDAIGANNDSINAARVSGGSSASAWRIWISFLKIMRPVQPLLRLRS
ncbi:MAG TPA: hypothetical protein VG475_06665 [Pseudolabrys sp.]|nr:hypothetical protein [Pseudolabrys sp.]